MNTWYRQWPPFRDGTAFKDLPEKIATSESEKTDTEPVPDEALEQESKAKDE
jgi:hypothetical protein